LGTDDTPRVKSTTNLMASLLRNQTGHRPRFENVTNIDLDRGHGGAGELGAWTFLVGKCQ
jgi:hypothetical protein